MFATGIVALIVGAVLVIGGLFGDTTAATQSSGFGVPTRVHNIGLLGQQAALVSLGNAFMLIGTVLVVGAKIIDQLGAAASAAKVGMQAAVREMAAGVAAPRSSPSFSAPQVPAGSFAERAEPEPEPPRFPDEAWDVVEARAIELGYSVHRIRQEIRLRRGDESIVTVKSLPRARSFLGMPPLDEARSP